MNTIDTEKLINFLLSQQTQEKTIEIKQAYNMFMDHLDLNNRKGTKRGYIAALKPLMSWFRDNDIYKTHQVKTDVITRFVKARKPLVKPQTINKEVCSFKTMLNLLIKKDYLDKLPFKFEKLKAEKYKSDVIDIKSLDKILKYFNKSSKLLPKYKLVFLLMLTTGIRTTELLNIKNSNINLKDRYIYLEYTKTHETRKIYLVENLISLVRNVMTNHEFLFLGEDGHQMTDNAVRCFFKHLKRDLDIDILSPRKLRHYYATNIYKKSLDIYLVSKLLGHTNIKTTEIYLDIDNKDHQVKNDYYNPLKDLL